MWERGNGKEESMQECSQLRMKCLSYNKWTFLASSFFSVWALCSPAWENHVKSRYVSAKAFSIHLCVGSFNSILGPIPALIYDSFRILIRKLLQTQVNRISHQYPLPYETIAPLSIQCNGIHARFKHVLHLIDFFNVLYVRLNPPSIHFLRCRNFLNWKTK